MGTTAQLELDPATVTVDREARLWWTWADGTRLPVVAGGDGEDDDEGDDDEDDDDLEELADLTVRQLAELTALTDEQRTALAELEEEGAGGLTEEEATELRAKLKKANARAKKLRQSLRQGKKPEPDDDDKADNKSTRNAVAAVLKAELRSAGASDGLVRRAPSLVDLEGLEVDDEGDVDGLEELLEELRGDFPEAFKAKAGAEGKGTGRRRRKVPPGGGGKRDEPGAGKGKSTGERLAAQLAGLEEDD